MPDWFSDEKFKLLIFGAVSLVWVLVSLASVLLAYEIPQSTHAIMAGVVGYFVGSRLKKS